MGWFSGKRVGLGGVGETQEDIHAVAFEIFIRIYLNLICEVSCYKEGGNEDWSWRPRCEQKTCEKNWGPDLGWDPSSSPGASNAPSSQRPCSRGPRPRSRRPTSQTHRQSFNPRLAHAVLGCGPRISPMRGSRDDPGYGGPEGIRDTSALLEPAT